MRIISGRLRGRVLSPDKNLPVRPTTDFAKTGLFNILSHQLYWEDIAALDLFAGTGSISFEMYSRGCDDITAVDQNPLCINYIRKHCEKFNVSAIRTVRSGAREFIKTTRVKYDLIFADPPYQADFIAELPTLIQQKNILSENGTLVLEHSDMYDFSTYEGFSETRRYGHVHFSFFSNP